MRNTSENESWHRNSADEILKWFPAGRMDKYVHVKCEVKRVWKKDPSNNKSITPNRLVYNRLVICCVGAVAVASGDEMSGVDRGTVVVVWPVNIWRVYNRCFESLYLVCDSVDLRFLSSVPHRIKIGT